MPETSVSTPELPNLVTLFWHQAREWENIIFSLIIIAVIAIIAYLGCRRKELIPQNRFQTACETIFGFLDDFVCGVLGPQGRRYTPFIGTLFIYILCMNLAGIVPFLKSPSASWSTTLALALCVFVYVQYAGLRKLGARGYLDHMLGRPRGIVALSVFIPLLMFFLHIIAELVKPISLSLRLRSNMWGDDMLLAVIAGFGLKGVPLFIFSSLLAIIASIVQAVVFCLLTTIYFALVLTEEETEEAHT